MKGPALLIVLATALCTAGCGDDEKATDSGVELVSFKGDAGTDSQTVFAAGGLSIEARCSDETAPPFLSVVAKTAVDDAWISSQFDAKAAPKGGYRFVMDDFDRDYGGWDFLGSGIDQAVGTLEFVNPQGDHITLNFVADKGTPTADCLFSGSAAVATDG